MENLKKHLFPGSRPTGVAESKSVFHINNIDNDHLMREVQGCYESFEEFRNALKNADGAGTHLTESLARALKETSHGAIAEHCGAMFREVYAGELGLAISQQLQEMSLTLNNLKHTLEDTPAELTGAEYSEILCKLLLLFLKCQQDYHKFCSDKMVALVRKLTASKGLQNQDEITEHFLSLVFAVNEDPLKSENNMVNHVSSNSPKGSPKIKKANPSPSSPKSPVKQTFKSSLRSLFERKPSPEEGKSAFYVDIQSSAAGCKTEEQGSTPAAGRPHTEQKHPAQPRTQHEQIPGEVPQANLLGLDPDLTYQGIGQGLPQLTEQGKFSALVNQGYALPNFQVPPPMGQGPILRNIDHGQVLFDLIAASETCDPKLAANAHLKSSMVGLDPSFPSHLNPVVSQHRLQLPPGFSAAQGCLVDGQLASEEELESVINLLSGVNCSNSPMQAIPENQVQGPVQLTVPQIYRMPSPASDSHVEEMKHPKYQMHRRSEGCLDLSGVQGNTWPHQQRASLPAIQSGSQKQYIEASRDSTVYMRRYSQEMHMPYRPSPGLVPPNVGQVMPGSQWPYPGSGNWPVMQAPKGSSTMNSSWSGVQDSSDLSDDSSSGEQFYAVGRDLVQAIDSKDDSSDDECDRRQEKQNYLGAPAAMEYQEKSSMHTWPPKQQWSHSNLYLNTCMEELEPADNTQRHRPVQMQWSDPMSSRSMWPAGPPLLGVPQQRTSQSMQGFGTLQ